MAKREEPVSAPERIAKAIARSGLCSRRDAERLIGEGRVKLAGAVVTTPATVVDADAAILVDDKPLAAREKARLWRYHKPDGLVTSHRDEKGRPTVFDKLPEGMPRVISVGRLDLTSEGLLLLTNDGALARALELPSTGWKRRYRVRAYGRVDDARLARLAKGVTVDGVNYGPIEAAVERAQGDNSWLSLSLREGKNREVRKVLEHMGLAVNRLIRVAYGPFQLGSLPRGAVDEVSRGVMRAQLGHLLADGGDTQGAAKAKPGPTQRRGTKPPPKPERPPRDAQAARPEPAAKRRRAKPDPAKEGRIKRAGPPTGHNGGPSKSAPGRAAAPDGATRNVPTQNAPTRNAPTRNAPNRRRRP